MKDFADEVTRHGVELDGIPLEAPWLLGLCEKMGGTWKEIWRRVCQDCQVEGLDDARTTSTIITQVQNSSENVEGFSPSQWVLGSHKGRLPGSLLEDAERGMLEVQEAASDPTSAMARNLQRRESARLSRVRMDNDNRTRTAALRKSAPSRGPFPVGAYVYFRRSQVHPGESPDPTHRWFGVARVIGHEVYHPERADDPDEANPDEINESTWLRYRQGTILASPNQLRFATEDEILMWTELDEEMLEPHPRGPRQYVDIRGEDLTGANPVAEFSQDASVVPPAPATEEISTATENFENFGPLPTEENVKPAEENFPMDFQQDKNDQYDKDFDLLMQPVDETHDDVDETLGGQDGQLPADETTISSRARDSRRVGSRSPRTGRT